MTITINKLVRSRRRSIALIVENDGSLVVRAPMRMPDVRIREFVDAHQDWVTRHQAKAQKVLALLPKFEEGQEFLFLGQKYPLRIVNHQRGQFQFDGKSFVVTKKAFPMMKDVLIAWYKQMARIFLAVAVERRADELGYKYKKIRISSARTRWGSCSTSGTLSFTYRLIMAPEEVIDYVIVHELVHTKVRNHSKTFWNNVARIMPDYKLRMAWLKKNGHYLL